MLNNINAIQRHNNNTSNSLPLSSAQKQVDNFLITREFNARIGEQIRAEEKAQLENEKNQKFTEEQKEKLYASHLACKKVWNGTYTIQNTVTNDHITVKIETIKDVDSKLFGQRIISLMVGSDNESSYLGIGFFDSVAGVKIWKKAESNLVAFNARRVKNGKKEIILDALMPVVWSLVVKGKESKFAKIFTVTASKTCVICNRKLTTPFSLLTGIGDKCYQDLHGGK